MFKRSLMEIFSGRKRGKKVTEFKDIPLNENMQDDEEIYRFTERLETDSEVNKIGLLKLEHSDTYRFSKVGYKLGEIIDDTENFKVNSFACGGVLPTDLGLPNLKIRMEKGFQHVSLPIVEESYAEKVIKSFTKAPYGDMYETVLDEKVRKTYQLEPSDLEIGNSKWDKSISTLIETEIKRGLGIPSSQPVCHSLYKLLLYETGGHFEYHRDTEKADRMFATLTIMLPSVFSGGHLLVKHGSTEKEFDYAQESTPYYSAFYCDCEHKVTPITSGYRLCLVYNLCFDKENDKPIDSSKFEKLFTQLEGTVEEWIRKPEKPVFAYLLNHFYSAKSISASNLKRTDVFAYNFLREYNKKCKPENKLEVQVGLFERDDSGMVNSDFCITDDSDSKDSCSKEYELQNVEGSLYLASSDKKVTIRGDDYSLISSDFIPNQRFKNSFGGTVQITRYGNDGVQFNMVYECGCFLIYPSVFSNIVKSVKRMRDSGLSSEFKKFETNPSLKEELVKLAKATIHSSAFFESRCTWSNSSAVNKHLEAFIMAAKDEELTSMLEKYKSRYILKKE